LVTIESVQEQIGVLIRTVESDLDRRGLLMLDRARMLLTAIKSAQLNMSLCEKTTPVGFFTSKGCEQTKTLRECETRLQRIIRGTAIPMEDNERA
jgi:hypothetical protein